MEKISPSDLVEMAFKNREIDKLFLGVGPYALIPKFSSTSLKTDIGYLLTQGLIPYYEKNPEIAKECYIVLERLSKVYNGLPIVASFIFNLSYSIHVLKQSPFDVDIEALARSLRESVTVNKVNLMADKSGTGFGFEKGVFEDLERLSKITTDIGGPSFFPQENEDAHRGNSLGI